MAENVAAACKKVRRFTWLFLPFRLRIQLLIHVFQISVQLNQPIVQQLFHYPQIIRLGSVRPLLSLAQLQEDAPKRHDLLAWASMKYIEHSDYASGKEPTSRLASAQPAVFEGTGGIGHSVTGHSVADKKASSWKFRWLEVPVTEVQRGHKTVCENSQGPTVTNCPDSLAVVPGGRARQCPLWLVLNTPQLSSLSWGESCGYCSSASSDRLFAPRNGRRF
jgi:hypothetical protein